VDEAQLRELDAALARLGDGDRRAADRVFALLWAPLVAFACGRLGDEGTDAAQIALTKVFAQASHYDPQRSALAWALAITSWECRSLLQKRNRRRERALDDAGDPGVSTDVDAQLDQEVQRSALQAALAQLSAQERATITRAFFEEQERAQTPAFRKQKERALQHLRTVWRRVYGSGR
jgi:RNA polymerase sigma factor (sigma-70 family)